MADLPQQFQFSKPETIEELVRQLEYMYFTLAAEINRKPDIIERNSNGLTTDLEMPNGTININSSTNAVQMLTNHTDGPATAVWTTLS